MLYFFSLEVAQFFAGVSLNFGFLLLWRLLLDGISDQAHFFPFGESYRDKWVAKKRL